MQNKKIGNENNHIQYSEALPSLLKLEEDIPLPADAGIDFDYYLYERYCKSSVGWKQKLFYLIKPALPHHLQAVIRGKYSKIQSQSKFPGWPIEKILIDAVEKYLYHILRQCVRSEIGRIAFWPSGKRFAVALTHDLEGEGGFRRMLQMAEMEKEYGFRSSWNIVPEGYKIDWNILDKLRSDGFELGVHGLRHDGKLFHSYRDFKEQAAEIRKYAKEWNAVGFRSPSTLRNVDWMSELGFDYDSSYHDSAPYEPQPGGCCAIWPYFIKDLVELPITLPQDHTLFHVLGYKDISIWKAKVDFIEKNGGLVVIDVHPDYMMTEDRLKLYEDFLKYIKMKPDFWHAISRDIAKWWRDRYSSHLIKKNGQYAIEGNITSEGRIIKTKLNGDTLIHEIQVKL